MTDTPVLYSERLSSVLGAWVWGRYPKTSHAHIKRYSRTPFTLMLVIQIAIYPDQLSPPYKSVENSENITCLEITGY